MNWLIGLFLIVHGMVHVGYLSPKPDDPNYPFTLERSWLLGTGGRGIGSLLAGLAVATFALAGLGFLGIPGLSAIAPAMTVIGSVTSLLVLLLFWRSMLILGVLIDLGLLYVIFVLGWKP